MIGITFSNTCNIKLLLFSEEDSDEIKKRKSEAELFGQINDYFRLTLIRFTFVVH